MNPQTARPKRLPAEAGVCLFVFGDLLIFGLFFSTYALYRAQSPQVFASSQLALHPRIGVTNTLILLSSSWAVAAGVRHARAGRGPVAAAAFGGAALCAVGFALLKLLEYQAVVSSGFTLTTNDFFVFYYMFTGIHLLHVLIGIGVLVFMARLALGQGADGTALSRMEGGACFWHLVDLLWVVLFALFYLTT
jgi:nitric oxide reductase NorE protein